MPDYLAWKSSSNGKYFGAPDESHERLHKPWPAAMSHELVETSYFGFSIPEENINGEIYHWVHPRFGISSGGILIWRGMIRGPAFADFCDWRNYMPLPDDIIDCTYVNGVTVRMTRPQEEFEINFRDEASNTSLQLVVRPIMPAAVRPIGGHFTQAVQNTGSLVLRGKRYAINGYSSRDRSWGDPRPEPTQKIPPVAWMVPVFGEDLAFHLIAFDSADVPKGKDLLWGYVWKDGVLLGVKGCRKSTARSGADFAPRQIELELTDERDQVHSLTGTVQAMTPFAPWPNVVCYLCLTRWTYGNRQGYGEVQESVYPQALGYFAPPSVPAEGVRNGQ